MIRRNAMLIPTRNAAPIPHGCCDCEHRPQPGESRAFRLLQFRLGPLERRGELPMVRYGDTEYPLLPPRRVTDDL